VGEKERVRQCEWVRETEANVGKKEGTVRDVGGKRAQVGDMVKNGGGRG